MTDRKHPFDPQEVEKQVDQLSSSSGETYGTSNPDQRFLHDLRLVLAAEENDAQSEADDHFLKSAWTRITATGNLSQHTTQRAYPAAQHRRFTVMSTLPSTPDRQIARRGSFKRRLTVLAAAIAAFVLVGTLAVFALASHTSQPNTSTGSSQQTAAPQNKNSYTYYQVGQLPVCSVQWSLDSKRIISASENVIGWDAFSGSDEVRYDVQLERTRGPKPLCYSGQLSPNGKTLAVWNLGQIELYNVATGKHLSTLIYPFTQTPGAKAWLPNLSSNISWSPDGNSIRALASFPTSNFSRTNKLVTFNVATGSHQDLSLSLTGLLDQIGWSPNGKYVAVGYTSEDTVSVLNVANGQVVSSLPANDTTGHPTIESIEAINWSPDSSKVSAYFGNNISPYKSGLYIWDAMTAKNVVVYHSGTGGIWSPNGKYIAMIDGAVVKILDASTGKVMYSYTSQASSGYGVLAWSPDSSALAAGGQRPHNRGGVVNVWKITF